MAMKLVSFDNESMLNCENCLASCQSILNNLLDWIREMATLKYEEEQSVGIYRPCKSRYASHDRDDFYLAALLDRATLWHFHHKHIVQQEHKPDLRALVIHWSSRSILGFKPRNAGLL